MVIEYMTTLHDAAGDTSHKVMAEAMRSVQGLISHILQGFNPCSEDSDHHAVDNHGFSVCVQACCQYSQSILAAKTTSREAAAHKHAVVSDVLWMLSYLRFHRGWRPESEFVSFCMVHTLLLAAHESHSMHFVAQEHLLYYLNALRFQGDEQLLQVGAHMYDLM